jgi:hypothetical protein
MVICIVALVVFGVLSLFSARYRPLAKDAFICFFRTIQFKPCETKLDQRIRSKLTAKLMGRTPTLARFVYKNFKILSWIFTITFFASMAYSINGVYNLIVYGSCDPSSSTCVITQATAACNYEELIVYGIIAALAVLLLYVAYRYWKNRE